MNEYEEVSMSETSQIPTALGVMIEGQEGLTWERWHALTDSAENLGFDSLWRSDHLFSVMGESQRETLALWPSLTAAALRTSRIKLGQLVSPTTFRHPIHLASDAVALDQLSEARFILGVGAGWNVGEHEAFGFDLRTLKDRMDRFEESLKVITGLWTGEPFSFSGKHFQLDNARTTSLPRFGTVPLVLGGSGEKRTLRLVAQYADEWNMTGWNPELYDHKTQVLEQHCAAVGRPSETIRRSIMHGHIIGATHDEVVERAAKIKEIQIGVRDMEPAEAAATLKSRGWLVGTPEEIVEGIHERRAHGVTRIMLQTYDMDDHDALKLFAEEVIPHI